MPNWNPAYDPRARRFVSVSPAYVGPLDLVPGAVVAYSQRAMAAAWTGNAVRIRESGGDTEQNFTTAVGNAVDVAAITTFLNGNDGFVVTHFDQSGNGDDATQATGSKQPEWVASAVNSKPAMTLDGTQYLATADAIALANGTYTVMAVIASGGNAKNMFGGEGASDYIITKVGSNPGNMVCDAYQDSSGDECGMLGTATLGASYHVVEYAWTFGDSKILVDGVEVTFEGSNDSGAAPGTITERLCVGTNSPVFENAPFIGTIVELIGYNSVLSAGNRTAIRQNMATYYGITLP